MSAWLTASITFGCAFGGAMFGMWLRGRLPAEHLNENSQSTVNLITGLVATLSALVLGLLIASAKTSFDAVGQELKNVAVKTILADRTLAQYGPETADIRQLIRRAYAARISVLFPQDTAHADAVAGLRENASLDLVARRIHDLAPANDSQRSLRDHALQMIDDVRESTWVAWEDVGVATPPAFVAVLVSWITVMFTSFGLFAPRHRTTLIALAIGAASVSTAVFLIEEMSNPFDGLIAVSPAPMRKALSLLGT